MSRQNKFLYWGAQFAGWGTLCMLSIMSSIYEGSLSYSRLALILSDYGTLLLVSHGIRLLILKFNWLNIKFGPFIPRAFILALTGSVIVVICRIGYHKLYGVPFQNNLSFANVSLNVLWISIIMIFWTSIYMVYHLFNKSRVQELTNLQLATSQREIELKNLRNQLNPHFLFNSLNSIRALIDLEPSVAKKSVTTLSKLLRNSLVLGSKPLISLGEEIVLVQEYLELEKIRFEERLQIEWNISASEDILLPPFILQTQVENALKHGISKLESGGKVSVNIELINNSLILEVQNSGELNFTSNRGIGLENTKRRLKLQYGDRAKFSIKEIEGMVVSRIKIEQDESINN